MSIRPKTSFVKKNDDEELQNSDISELNKYLDCFYEESFPTKVKGARMILYLSLEPNNLYEMLYNENFLNVVSRTLRENHNIHSEFCIHLLCFFYGLSAYKNFHEILTNYEIGGACLTIIDFQLKKYTVRKEGLSLKLESPDFAKELEKFTFMIRKQDRILKLAFGLLLNLADNLKVERVLAKKEIATLLIKFLDRSNINLLVIILLFLKKLSIYEVNKNEIVKNNIVGQLTKLLGYTHHLIIKISLELIYNLSFEPKFIKQIVANVDFFKQIISLFIKVKNMRSLIIKILYNISKYPETASLFSETDCMEIIYELIIKFPEPKLELELAALTLNLTTYPQNCEVIAKENKIKLLLERAFKNSDFYLIKIVKNIIKFGENEDLNDMFENYIDQFIETLQTKKSDDSFGTELIEILSSIETDWTDKVEKYGLIEFIETNLEKFNGIQDILFKLILFLGNISKSPVSIFKFRNVHH